MNKTQKQRLQQLVRQGIIPNAKLQVLMRAIGKSRLGVLLTPDERNVMSVYLDKLQNFVLGDQAVFNRARTLNTQRSKYQTEESTVEIDENVRIVDGPEEEEKMRKTAETKAKRLSVRKRDKYRMLSPELKKEKSKAGMDEEVANFHEVYKDKFDAALEYYGVTNIRDLPEDKKAEFFAVVDEATKMAKKDHDGDGKIETSTAEYLGSRDKAIKKATKPSWDSKQARANALNSLDKKAQARQDMKKESFEDNEKRREKARADMAADKYNKDGSRKVVKLKGFGPDAAKGNMSNPAARAALMKKEEAEIEEDMQVKQAIGIASDKRYKGGNMTGAVNAIEKMRKGLSDHPQVKAVLKRQNEETERLDEYGNPAATPDRLAMIRRAADRVQSGAAAKDAEKRAKADMKQKGAQKGMAPTKKDVEEQVMAIRKVIKEGSAKEKIEAYKELNQIIEQFKTTGEL